MTTRTYPLPKWLRLQNIFLALLYGGGAALIMWANISVPILGTDITIDPREILVSLGAASTGPLGAFIIGVMAGLYNPVSVPISAGAHIIAAIWISIAYKYLVYRYLSMPWRLIGWVGLIVTYYYAALIPAFIGLVRLNPVLYDQIFGENVHVIALYRIFLSETLPEVLLTAAVTTLILVATPGKYHRPAW